MVKRLDGATGRLRDGETNGLDAAKILRRRTSAGQAVTEFVIILALLTAIGALLMYQMAGSHGTGGSLIRLQDKDEPGSAVAKIAND